jgi:hypothetical protein
MHSPTPIFGDSPGLFRRVRVGGWRLSVSGDGMSRREIGLGIEIGSGRGLMRLLRVEKLLSWGRMGRYWRRCVMKTESGWDRRGRFERFERSLSVWAVRG